MRTFFIILLLAGWLAGSGQQPAAPVLLYRFPDVRGPVQADNLGNLYVVNEDGRISKRGPAGDSLAVFNQVRRNGKLSSLDLSNPLRPLLLYRDFAKVVVLDRFLAPLLTLDLRAAGIQQPAAAATSFDNKIWVFDLLASKLKKLDDNGNILLETADLRQVFGAALQPVQIIDHNNWLYLCDPATGVYVFDYFGNFKRKMPLVHWQHLQVWGNYVYGIEGGLLWRYHTGTLVQESLPLPAEIRNCPALALAPGKLISWCSGNCRLYQLQP